jgi:hypothetical protein
MKIFFVRTHSTKVARTNGHLAEFAVPVEGQAIEISKFLKTFIWYHPLTQTFDIHEELSGLQLASGITAERAVAAVKHLLTQITEDRFFQTLRAAGPIALLPKVESFAEGLNMMGRASMEHFGFDKMANPGKKV